MGLADPYLKTFRAKEHLENLRRELKVFYESKPYEFIFEDDIEKQKHLIRFKVKDTPDKISLIVGDIFYCLRAALDQLVWALAKLSLPYPEGTQFPILEQPDASRIARQTRGVPAEAVAIIEGLQPYNAPNSADVHSHLLWRLNKMCIIDKHMRIPVHGSSGVLRSIIPDSMLGMATFDEDLVMRIPLALKNHVALNPDVSLKVTFGDMYWGIQCDIEGIETIYAFVANNVIPRICAILAVDSSRGCIACRSYSWWK